MKELKYTEPEFKAVKMSCQDVLTGSLDSVDPTWDTGSNTQVNANSLFGI